jgi:subtilisin family serine protease
MDPRRIAALAAALGVLACAAVATPVSAARAGAGAPYVVVLTPGTPARQVAGRAAGLVHRYGGVPGRVFAAGLPAFAVTMPPAAAVRMAADPAVAYLEPDGAVSLAGTEKPVPSWGLDRVDQRPRRPSGSYRYPAGGGAGVTVYVLDTGIRVSHTDFGGRARYGWDFIGNDRYAGDCNGHGTHVAGTVGGTRYGVAKRVRLVAVRVLDCQGRGSYSQIIAGIDWVVAHAARPAVVNMSLEGPADSVLDDAVRRAIAAGITFVVAAGNHGRDACTESPARTPQALTVAATDRSDARARFSNYGRCVDLFAPGVAIVSDWNSGNRARALMSGTSMAAPHVAGAAALVLSAHRRWTPAQVRAALVSAATRGHLSRAGRGSPNLLLYVR